MNTKVQTVFVAAFALLFGVAIGSATITFAQNGTSTDSEQFSAISTNMIIAIVALVGTGVTFLKTLADRGLLDKRIGSVAVIAGDSVVAIKDNRELIQEGLKTGFETVAISNPETAKEILDKSAPIMKKVTERVDEYNEKAGSFTRIASKIGKQGERTTDDIKENEELKENIPDSVVPT
jgi:hypothetical protein